MFPTYLIVILIPDGGYVLRADVPKVLQVLRLRLVAVLDPFHLLGAVILYSVDLTAQIEHN